MSACAPSIDWRLLRAFYVAAAGCMHAKLEDRKSGFPAQDKRTKKITGKAATYAFFIGSYFMIALMAANLIKLEHTGSPLLDIGYALVVSLLVQSLTFLGLRLCFNRKSEF